MILFLVTVSFIQTTFSQSVPASGTVKDANGNPIPAALVSEFKSIPAAATYTDSLGFFYFPVKKFSKLIVSCKGYNDTLINLNDKKEVSIILTKAKNKKPSNDAAANNIENSVINKNLVEDGISTQTGVSNSFVYSGAVKNYTGSLMPVFSQKEETKGSRYLFNEWSHGSITNDDNTVFNDAAYLYNYDKMGGGLLLTRDKQSAIEADKARIKTFTLYDVQDSPLVYESVPSIDDVHFVQVISSGKKYNIYKLTKTKFVKSNYHTDGIATTGNPYDEYVDDDSYFALNHQNSQMQKFFLKKKSMKEAFALESEKLNKFFSENSTEAINQLFLKNLGDYLNKEF